MEAGKEGDIVLDQFCGSGTTLLVAQRLNRKFIGVEIDKNFCETAIKRLNNLKNEKTQDFNRLF